MRSRIDRYPKPGRTFYVSAAGNDANRGTSVDASWRTLAAVNAYALKPGDRVLLNKGDTWTNVRLLLTASGNARRPIYIGAYGTGAAPIVDDGTTDVGAFHTNGQSWIVIDGLDLRGGTQGTVIIITEGITIQNCNIQGNGSSAADGVQCFSGATNVRLIGNTITGHKCVTGGGGGVYLSHVDRVLIQGNTIHTNGDAVGDQGIYVHSSTNVLIKGNTCYSNYSNGIQVQDTGTAAVVVDGNTCYSNGDYGIWFGILDAGNGCIAKNNLCYANTNAGLGIGSTVAGPIGVYHNTLVNNVANGLILYNTTNVDNIVKNNIVLQDGAVVANNSKRPYRIADANGAANNVFDYNLVSYKNSSDGGKVVNVGAPTYYYTWAEWQALAAAPDAHSVNDDAHFATEYTDFHLTAGSHAVNAGVAIAGCEYDKDGVLRADPPDIGCYEYVA